MEDDSFFTHFIVAGILSLALFSFALVAFLVVSLWQAGFGIFVVVVGSLYTFGWTVHKLATSKTVNKWINKL